MDASHSRFATLRPSTSTPVRFTPALRGLVAPLLAVVAFAALGAPALAQDAVVFRNATVIDGTRDAPLEGATVVVANGRIQLVGAGEADAPAGARVIDLEGRYLLPGMIDAHVHVSSLDAARRALESGVTTVRSASTGAYQDVSLRALVEAGAIPGPDVLATGTFVTPRPSLLADPRMAALADGVETEEALRTLVRINADRGVDVIKTRGTERAGLPDTDPRKQVYSQEQIGWIVDEAGLHGLPVMAHAHGDEGGRAAVLAGVRSIEHGTYLSEETLRLMAERGTFLVPTYTVVTDLVEPGGDYDNPVLQLRGRHMMARLARTIRTAREVGVPIVASTDTGYGPGSIVRVSHEVGHFVEMGMSPLEAIRSATTVAAELLQIESRTGAVVEGLEADLIVVPENPLEHIGALEDVLFVMSNGRIGLDRLQMGLDGERPVSP